MTKTKRFVDLIAAHPFFDHIVPLAALALWYFVFDSLVPADVGARQWAYAAVATLASISLAASLFVCTMIYQSHSELVVAMRRKYNHELQRNWIYIIFSALSTALLAILSLIIEYHNQTLAFALVVYGIVLLSVSFVRTVFWLRFLLFIEDYDARSPLVDAPQLQIDSTSD